MRLFTLVSSLIACLILLSPRIGNAQCDFTTTTAPGDSCYGSTLTIHTAGSNPTYRIIDNPVWPWGASGCPEQDVSQNSNTFSNLHGGKYTVWVSCPGSGVWIKHIDVASSLSANWNLSAGPDSSVTPQTLTVSGSGGSGAYTYHLAYKNSSGTWVNVPSSGSDSTFTIANGGWYYFVVQDGCCNYVQRFFKINSCSPYAQATTVTMPDPGNFNGGRVITVSPSGYLYEYWHYNASARRMELYAGPTTNNQQYMPASVNYDYVRVKCPATGEQLAQVSFTVTSCPVTTPTFSLTSECDPSTGQHSISVKMTPNRDANGDLFTGQYIYYGYRGATYMQFYPDTTFRYGAYMQPGESQRVGFLCGGERYIGDATVPLCVRLPVTLEHFRAVPQDCGTTLLWKTSKEENFDYFLIEKSNDARTFSVVSRVDAKGTGHAYSLSQKDLPFGTYYYRLKMVDKDGTSEYSNVVSQVVSCEGF
ncbi:MAG: hypothetical protein J7576_23690, partial [Siphonobacter aquaeclarae]|nr:hypothetical protein [Siphonobacter aquaeclarae]